jgi:hypothetical protein
MQDIIETLQKSAAGQRLLAKAEEMNRQERDLERKRLVAERARIESDATKVASALAKRRDEAVAALRAAEETFVEAKRAVATANADVSRASFDLDRRLAEIERGLRAVLPEALEDLLRDLVGAEDAIRHVRTSDADARDLAAAGRAVTEANAVREAAEALVFCPLPEADLLSRVAALRERLSRALRHEVQS